MRLGDDLAGKLWRQTKRYAPATGTLSYHANANSSANAMRIVRHSDLLGLIPQSCLGTASAGGYEISAGLHHFELPARTPRIKVSAIWHPRLHADPAHRWLRDTILAVCKSALPVNP